MHATCSSTSGATESVVVTDRQSTKNQSKLNLKLFNTQFEDITMSGKSYSQRNSTVTTNSVQEGRLRICLYLKLYETYGAFYINYGTNWIT